MAEIPGAGVGGREESGHLQQERHSASVTVTAHCQAGCRPASIVVRHHGNGGRGLSVALCPRQSPGDTDHALVLHVAIYTSYQTVRQQTLRG